MKNRVFGLPISFVVAVIVILGALFHREFPRFGAWVVVAAIVVYVVLNFRFALYVLRSIKKRGKKDIVLLLLYIGFASIIPSIIISDDIPFFTIITLLAFDYLIKEKND